MVLHPYIKYQSTTDALWLYMIPSCVGSRYVAGGHDMAWPLHQAGRLTGLYLASIWANQQTSVCKRHDTGATGKKVIRPTVYLCPQDTRFHQAR